LCRIYTSLQQCRGFTEFVRRTKLGPVDFFVPELSLIVEFDESQHFTTLRGLALSLYPQDREFGFSLPKWSGLCAALHRHDNRPFYRDEQRAWYDSIRDFAQLIWGRGRTVRLYAGDRIWCAPDLDSDLPEPFPAPVPG